MSEVQDSRCPKCGHPEATGASSCARCGLVFALWSPQTAQPLAALDGRAEALWGEARQAWEEASRHEAFIKHCSAAGLLGAAGRRYREHLDRTPGDAIATRMQERILAMATVGFTVRSRAPQPVTRTRWFWAVVLLFGVTGVLAGVILPRLVR